MSDARTDVAFSSSISKLYETHLVPMIFEPYARHLVDCLPKSGLTRVLEVAAGTGVVTRALAAAPLAHHTATTIRRSSRAISLPPDSRRARRSRR